VTRAVRRTTVLSVVMVAVVAAGGSHAHTVTLAQAAGVESLAWMLPHRASIEPTSATELPSPPARTIRWESDLTSCHMVAGWSAVPLVSTWRRRTYLRIRRSVLRRRSVRCGIRLFGRSRAPASPAPPPGPAGGLDGRPRPGASPSAHRPVPDPRGD
jgi:hypothetical protein